jgi:hypothetical protein
VSTGKKRRFETLQRLKHHDQADDEVGLQDYLALKMENIQLLRD